MNNGDLRMKLKNTLGVVIGALVAATSIGALAQGQGAVEVDAFGKRYITDSSRDLSNGNLLATAEVLKGLLILQRAKPLSFREKKMLDRARHMLITEISISRGICEEKAIVLLQRSLGRAELTLPSSL